jgi:hypothetical protein
LPAEEGRLAEDCAEATGASNVSAWCCVPTTAATVRCHASLGSRGVVPRHNTLVTELHKEVLQATSEIDAERLKSLLPKFRPVTVTLALPLVGMLSRLYEAAGASNVYAAGFVPGIAPTVIIIDPTCDSSTLDTHDTLEEELHAAVLHNARPNDSDIVKSIVPKLRPVTVTEGWPDDGKFLVDTPMYETVGASKVRMALSVPATAATVTTLLAIVEVEALDMQATEVLLDQDAVEHRASASCTVAVVATLPKLKPITVTEAPPDLGTLSSA